MLALVYRIIGAIISLSDLVGPKNRTDPRFKRIVIELVVYPILLIAITAWLIFLMFGQGIQILDIPSVLALVAAQEVTIDLIVNRVSKKLQLTIDEEDKT